VLLATPREHVDLRIVADRPLDESRDGRTLESREVLAGQEADEVGGAEDGLAVDELQLVLPAGASRQARS
jgi:hypothetical protein